MVTQNSDLFSSQGAFKILSFLLDRPDKDFTAGEIRKVIGLSRAGIYVALHALTEKGLITKTRRGRFLFFSAAHTEPLVKQYKVIKNILGLEELINKLKPVSKRIILFGSTERGEDTLQSDIDLFIVSSDPGPVREVLAKIKSDRKIQPVILTPAQIPEFQEKEKVFYREVERGITLWENSDER